MIRPRHRWLMRCTVLTLHCFCHHAWHTADPLISTRTLPLSLSRTASKGKKKQEEEAASEWRETRSWGKTACVCIYWLMNQYGFSYSERAGCNGEWVSVAPTWSQGTVARSPLIASRRFVRGAWMKGVTAKRYEEYKSYYSSYRRPMAMALITGSDLLYPWLRPHKHPGAGRCVWSLFHVDSLHH